MELKCEIYDIYRRETAGSNRTFMELKYMPRHTPAGWRGYSNRTFMELKWIHKAFFFLVSFVLIVPLWN